MAKLIVVTGAAEGVEVDLEEGGGAVIGRDEGADLTVSGSEMVGAGHATLRHENSRWFVTDGGTLYGTFVNGRRIKEQGLQHDDVIELGLGGPRIRYEAGAWERAQSGASTAGRLKQYYEEMARAESEEEPEPLEGAGKIAMPTATRGVLIAVAAVVVIALGAFWMQSGTAPGEEVQAGASGGVEDQAVRPGGALYPLDRASRTYYSELPRMRAAALGSANGGSWFSDVEAEFRAVSRQIDAGVAGGAALDSLSARQAELQRWLAEVAGLTEMAAEVRGSLVVVQAGYRVDGRYFAGPSGTGFVVDDGRIVTTRHIVEPDRYARSPEEASLACAVEALAIDGMEVAREVAAWTVDATPGYLESGALDPATASFSTREGDLRVGDLPDLEDTRLVTCPDAGVVVESLHAAEDGADVAVLLLADGAGDGLESLPLAGSGPQPGQIVFLAGFPRGMLTPESPDLPVWSTYAPVTDTGGDVRFAVEVPSGVHGAPLLDLDGRVVGVGTGTAAGSGVAVQVRPVRELLRSP